jgi:long-chain acyl-CoA synthetase
MFDALGRGSGGPLAPRRLRRAISAGSPLPPSVAERFQRLYGVPLCQIYGATEFGSVAFNGPELWEPARGAYRPGCVGQPFPDVEIRVVEGDDPTRPVSFGVEGQVAVASPSMLSEYLGVSDPVTRDGFLLTGDLGVIDDSGMLELTGRTKFMVDIGGQKVNPLEVEAVLVEHPGVRDAVVVPTAYSETASRLKAIIIPEPGAEPTRDEIRRFAQERLIHYKVPRSIEITSDVPRSPTGKILRQKLLPGAAADSTP